MFELKFLKFYLTILQLLDIVFLFRRLEQEEPQSSTAIIFNFMDLAIHLTLSSFAQHHMQPDLKL